jgi:hypothetical protein
LLKILAGAEGNFLTELKDIVAAQHNTMKTSLLSL